MRLLSLFVLALAASLTASEPSPPTYPLWDGQETVADYAKRVNLPPTKTLDLGNGVKMELVLIPAGRFIMGAREPTPVDEEGFHTKIVTGQALLAASIGALLVMLAVVIVQAVRRRQRPKFSLARLLAMTVLAGIAVLSVLHWQESARGLEKEIVEFTTEKARFDSAKSMEKPAHPVTLTKPYYMGKFTVTQEQYQAAIGASPSNFNGKDNPVETVSWEDAQEFCTKLAKQTKKPVRLPTEAEWEFACRAGTTTTHYSGDADADLTRVAWYDGSSKGMTHPVGQKEPNVFGLYDMHGNVWQWCQDWLDSYKESEAENPQGPVDGGKRLLRGGSWMNNSWYCRSSARAWIEPNTRWQFIGFRVVVLPASRIPQRPG
jgi:formylglycine-generating enzyme required for sulfatase activity